MGYGTKRCNMGHSMHVWGRGQKLSSSVSISALGHFIEIDSVNDDLCQQMTKYQEKIRRLNQIVRGILY